MPRIALLSTSDTDLLTARASGADYVVANPGRPAHREMAAAFESADLIVARVLGSPRDLCEGFARIRAFGKPMVVLGGEQAPDAALMEQSTVPIGICAEAHRYLAQGGPENLRQLHAFLSDTVLLTGEGFEAPVEQPQWGALPRPAVEERQPLRGPSTSSGSVPAALSTSSTERSLSLSKGPAGVGVLPVRPRVAILFYRAQFTAGNTAYVSALADAIDDAGGVGVPVFAASLRDAPDDLIEHLGTYDALITTVLAAGGTRPANASAGGEDEGWDVRKLAGLDVPILQGLCLTTSRSDWAESDEGLSPLDVATQVAVPEFDGRIITVPFSFKEVDADGLPHYVPDPERCARVASLAVNHARLRHIPPSERKIAIVLSAYPTKHSRIGNAVGLDTPVSVIRLLRALREEGYDLGEPGEIPGTAPLPEVEDEEPDTTAGNALIHALIDAGGQDPEWLTSDQVSGQRVRISAAAYQGWLADLPDDLVEHVTRTWGEAPGELFVDRTHSPDGEIVAATLQAGNVVILVQPPRGFGENPIAIYHDPDMAPTHHYLAVYRWIEREFGAHAVVHVGKHGNLEWLPGKNLGMSASCGTDAALGSMPLIYPFLVNDPGEGTQAKRRAHATVIDHLVPPMARAEAYGDIARLEQLLDEYATVSAMDPAKAPALRGEIWTLVQAAEMHHDLGLDDKPDDETFDDFVLHVDGWLCEIKDVQIRDGLHILGQPPVGDNLVNLVLAVLRANQVFANQVNGIPGLRVALGLKENESSTGRGRRRRGAGPLPRPGARRRRLGRGQRARDRARAARARPPRARRGRGLARLRLPRGRAAPGQDDRRADEHAARARGRLRPRRPVGLAAPRPGEHPPDGAELLLRRPQGRALAAGLDDGAGDGRLAAAALPRRDRASTRPRSASRSGARRPCGPRATTSPRSSPCSACCRPGTRRRAASSGWSRSRSPSSAGPASTWSCASRASSGTPSRTWSRCSTTPSAWSPASTRPTRTTTCAATPTPTAPRTATSAGRRRGSSAPSPARTGRGSCRSSSPATGATTPTSPRSTRRGAGSPTGATSTASSAREDMESTYRRISVAAKNIDTREHDIADSDDYFQYHGGMVATVRSLTGVDPKAYVGDSTTPDAIRTRTLTEETARVFRSRVINPRWIAGMRKHGYKGAFELAATVDYLFGFDATTGVVPDWMYATLAETYVLDKENQDFLRHANPWALHAMVEKLSEAADRGLWEKPDPELMDRLQQVYLDVEGDLEDRVS